jgi:hypothetical protein
MSRESTRFIIAVSHRRLNGKTAAFRHAAILHPRWSHEVTDGPPISTRSRSVQEDTLTHMTYLAPADAGLTLNEPTPTRRRHMPSDLMAEKMTGDLGGQSGNTPWHNSPEVSRWIATHNATVNTGEARVCILSCPLPVKSPWLNPIEPKRVHGKKCVIEPARPLTPDELKARFDDALGADLVDHLSMPHHVA